jgi:hypothetical protein
MLYPVPVCIQKGKKELRGVGGSVNPRSNVTWQKTVLKAIISAMIHGSVAPPTMLLGLNRVKKIEERIQRATYPGRG